MKTYIISFVLLLAILLSGVKADLTANFYNGTNLQGGYITTDGLALHHTEVNPNIDYWDGSSYYCMYPGNLSSNYTGEWTGLIRIDVAGDYGFGTISDDGSQVFIDGMMVVDNGEEQWYDWEDNITEFDLEEPNEPVYLSEGYHSITVLFYEKGAYDGIELWWLTPGSGPSDIPYYGTTFHGTAPTANPATNWQIVPADVLVTEEYLMTVCGMDVDGDSIIGMYEYSLLAADWMNSAPVLLSDYTLDGTVDIYDLAYLADYWLCECPIMVE